MRFLPIVIFLYAIVNQTATFAADVQAARQIAKSFVLPKVAPHPANNPPTKEKIELGKQLYFDARLSVDGTVSCNSCHNVMSSGTDNRGGSVGVLGQVGDRGAPTVFNSAFMSALMWDGRKESLEDQATGPLLNPIEMAMPSTDAVVERLKNIEGYRSQFAKVFGGKDPVTIENFSKAMAAYERTLITPNGAFDQWAMGNNKAISAQAQKGFATFVDTGCASCHSGPNFSGPKLPQGTPFFQRFPTFADNEFVKKYDFLADTGRKKVTNQDADAHMFRVPTLRNIAITAPYFHNGRVATLDEAIRVMAKVQLNRDLNDNEVSDIKAFLVTLTGPIPDQKMPRLAITEGTTFTPSKASSNQ
jgi:cytochrome c peroxidase